MDTVQGNSLLSERYGRTRAARLCKQRHLALDEVPRVSLSVLIYKRKHQTSGRKRRDHVRERESVQDPNKQTRQLFATHRIFFFRVATLQHPSLMRSNSIVVVVCDRLPCIGSAFARQVKQPKAQYEEKKQSMKRHEERTECKWNLILATAHQCDPWVSCSHFLAIPPPQRAGVNPVARSLSKL